MCTPGLHWFPLAVFIVLPGTFILSYIIAVWLGHVEADFPYISDTGAMPPESCIFGQLLNIAAVLAAITTYIRYRQVEYYAGSVHMKRSNKVTLFMGLLSCLGISMVGNFQETEVLPMHIIGAMLAFGVSIVYCWVQTVMSYAACPRLGSKVLCHIRVAVCIIASVAFVITYVFNAISMHYYHGHDKRKWFPKDGGFTPHVISTASEWTMCISELIYFLTFAKEFQHISMTRPDITIVTDPAWYSAETLLSDPDEVIT